MTTERRRGTVTLRQVSGSARSKKVRVDLGDESSFTAFPAPVKVGDASYFLVRGRDGYKLLSTVCPHQGGEIEDEGDELFVCDGHGWQYEKAEGTCTNRPDFRMKAFLVTSQNDRLIALVPDE
jgi:CMP-N-acetylneuraminate monooxygenase